ncbi:MAG: DUF523 and DUF1722 domain-containing protein [Chloroflexi bacterium]|nr:DUF523 and DUF1722 domain-containing protein [Chloroflexota bacterium]MYF65014.1 DUF523 and DUF1722 domain-containing protein [Chloroflexota bacterium]MYK35561.1 DUF523 and DUF1722 domain-containing protein [Chloroflexota bacterium]
MNDSFPRPRIGVSACLLGEPLRYDGGHLHNEFLTQTLAPHVEWTPVCPESEMGMGTPREPVRLVDAGDGALRMRGVRSDTDHTDAMRSWAARRIGELAGLGLHGYVFTKNSPSCGLFRVKVYPSDGGPAARNGRGLFAEALTQHFPLLPVEEQGRLHDPRLRDNFIEQVFVYQRWAALRNGPRAPSALVAFHTAHKLTLMAHAPTLYREAGRVVARAGRADWDAITDEYGRVLMRAVERLTTARKHTNALQHAAGFLKQTLDAGDREELAGAIERYRTGKAPFTAPLTLLRHHVRRSGGPEWLVAQTYLHPYPDELMLGSV